MPAFRHQRLQKAARHQRVERQLGALINAQRTLSAAFFEGVVEGGVVNAESGLGEGVGGQHFAGKARAEKHTVSQVQHHPVMVGVKIPAPVIVRFDFHNLPRH